MKLNVISKKGAYYVALSNKFQIKKELLYYSGGTPERVSLPEAEQKKGIELSEAVEFFKVIAIL